MNLTEKRYETEYGTIVYWVSKVADHAPWLVFLPGLSADHRLFDKQLEALAREYNCFVWDAPAHGQSRPFALRFTMDDLSRYLHEIFAAEGIKSPVLIGQSLGGYIAQVYMALYPNTVSGFISIDSCSLQRKYYSWWELALLRHTKWMYLSIPWKLLLWWGILGTATTEYGRALMGEIWSVYEKVEFCELADHGYRIVVEAIESGHDYTLHCPALLICGEKDAAGSAKRYNREWTKLDHIPMKWIPGAGHNSNTDAPEVVNGLIRGFVESL